MGLVSSIIVLYKVEKTNLPTRSPKIIQVNWARLPEGIE